MRPEIELVTDILLNSIKSAEFIRKR